MSFQIQSTGTACFQREPLTVRLRNLIHDYPEGVGIVKELIQNADDAGAKRIQITFDWRQHTSAPLDASPTSGLPDSRMEALMGAAMVVYNDSTFSDADFENIQSLGESGKRETLWKTGRFGVGFNSVYHVTDYPSFISRDRIVFFDPHATAIPGTTIGEPGRSWLLADWWDYPNFMAVYAPGGLTQGTTNFNGTIFRLPLRTPAQAECSQIRTQPFLRDKNIEPLLTDLSLMGEEFLIFLKSIVEIKVCSIESDGTHHDLLTISTTNASEVIAQREQLQGVLKQAPADFWTMCQNRPHELPSVSYRHQIQTITPDNTITSDWRVVGMLRVDRQNQLLGIIRKLAEQKEKAVPWAGAAARISTHSTNGIERLFIGRTYCFLPLSESGLPIHINGFFDLDSSRTKLTSGRNLSGRDASRVQWNELLIKYTVAHACAKLVRDLVKDIGDTDPDRFYSFWAVDPVKDIALEQLSKHLLKILKKDAVIRATPTGKWLQLNRAYLLQENKQELFEQLSADGLAFANPPLPQRITSALTKAGIKLNYFTVDELFQHLKQSNSIACPIELAPLPSLRKQEWIYILIKQCLNVFPRLQCLPLAILADGTLEVFGKQKRSCIYTGTRAVRNIFNAVPQWFLDEELVEKFPGLEQCLGITQMRPDLVAQYLPEVMDSEAICSALQAGKSDDPNIQWLALVYQYLTEIEDDNLFGEFNNIPLVPGSDGKLHCWSKAKTPLWCDLRSTTLRERSRANDEIIQMMAFFDVLSVEAPVDLYNAIEKFIRKHPDQLIQYLSPLDFIDTIAEREAVELPEYDRQYYHTLLDWLATDRAVLQANEKTKAKLRQLRIYPTTADLLVSLTEENVYVLGAEDLPTVSSELNLLKLGADSSHHQTWKPLFEKLGVNILDRATFIQDRLIPNYQHTTSEEQLAALTWIRDHYDNAIRDIKNRTLDKQELKKIKTDFEQLVKDANLVRCEDGDLHPIGRLYDPNETIIKNILGNRAPIPNQDVYKEEWKDWVKFFKKFGMSKELAPQDLLDFVDSLIELSIREVTKETTDSCLKVLEYINSNWEKLKDSRIDRREIEEEDETTEDEENLEQTLIDALKERAWLPVEISIDILQKYPAALIPEHRLYKPSEVALWNNGRYLVASQRPLLNPTKELDSKLKKAFGLGSDRWEDVVAHLDKLIEWHSRNTSDDRSLYDNFDRCVRRVYEFLAFRLSDPKIIERLKASFNNRPCLWDNSKSKFWQATYTFQSDRVERFAPYWTTLKPEKSEIRKLFEALGQKQEPNIDDYLDLLDEIEDRSEFAKPLSAEDLQCAIKLLSQIASELPSNPSILEARGLYLLTEDGYLRDPADVMIPDASWREDSIRKMGAISILHPQVSSLLADIVNARSMARDVTEKPQGRFTPSHDRQIIECCDLWANNMRSTEFKQGLSRLIHHHNKHISRDIDLNWLKIISIIPADNISVDLYLDDLRIASDVSGDSYGDLERSKIYLRYDAERDDMRNYLTKAIVYSLADIQLDNLSLASILDIAPNKIEEKLKKLRISPLDLVVSYPLENTTLQGEISTLDRESSSPDMSFDNADEGFDTFEYEDTVDDEDCDSTQLEPDIITSATDLINRADNKQIDNRQHERTISIQPNHFSSFPSSYEEFRQEREYTNDRYRSSFDRQQLTIDVSLGHDRELEPNEDLKHKIDKAGIAKVLDYERQQGRIPKEQVHNNPGFDIISHNKSNRELIRTIEVKSKQGEWDSVLVSITQFELALKLGDDFWLYIVERALDDRSYRIYTVRNPAKRIEKFVYKGSKWKEISQYYQPSSSTARSIPSN